MTKALTLETLRSELQKDIRSGIDDVLSVVKDLAQLTSDRFDKLEDRMDGFDGRMDGFDGRMDGFDGRMDGFEGHMGRLENSIGNLETKAESTEITLRDHTMRFVQIQSSLDEVIAKQEAHHNDIVEIYSIWQKHQKRQKISATEMKDTELRLQHLISWAQQVSTTLNIPIKL